MKRTMKNNKQRLFEMMERVDPSFTLLSAEEELDNIKKTFSSEEINMLKNAYAEDEREFHDAVDDESPYYDPFAYQQYDKLKEVLINILKSNGLDYNNDLIKKLAFSLSYDFI